MNEKERQVKEMLEKLKKAEKSIRAVRLIDNASLLELNHALLLVTGVIDQLKKEIGK